MYVCMYEMKKNTWQSLFIFWIPLTQIYTIQERKENTSCRNKSGNIVPIKIPLINVKVKMKVMLPLFLTMYHAIIFHSFKTKS